MHTFDLGDIERYRADWGFFRDRRPDLYARSLT
jgi:N-carbamoylputrescine amidase